MKKSEVPQDKPTHFELFTMGSYALDENGNYELVPTEGWEPSNETYTNRLLFFRARREEVRQAVLAGKASPLGYHMEVNAMSVKDVAAYTGLCRWRVKRHLRPDVFNRLKPAVLQRYADLFRIPVADLLKVPE